MKLSGFAAGPYQTNTYFLTTETHAVVVDPGMHTADRTVDFLAEHNLELDAVVLTHGHIDHTRDAGTITRRFGVPAYIHAADEFMLIDGRGVSPQSRIVFDADNMTPIDEVRHLEDGETLTLLGEEFTIRHAPGHSPGSTLLVHEDFALVGDVIFRGSIGRTDLPQSDPDAMEATLAGPVWELEDATLLLPGHGPTTTMRAERTTNPFLTQLKR